MSENDENLNQQEQPVKDDSPKAEEAKTGRMTFALAGNPNCGKTTLFNSLTGSTAYVGNWPGVTVEKRSGVYKNKNVGEADIVDLPGIYSLSPYSPEEIVSRNFILDSKPDCVINVIDGTNLERNLYMTTQILEMDVPVVLAINMIDAVRKNGMDIDCKQLSEKLGVPVVAVSALKRDNLDDLMKAAIEAGKKKREGTSILFHTESGEIVKQAEKIYEDHKIENPLFHAIKGLENDEIEVSIHKEEAEQVRALYHGEEDFESMSADKRYKYITENLSSSKVGKENEVAVAEKEKLSVSDKIDKVLTNKWAGIPIFLLILFITFELTFSEDLFFLNAAGVFGDSGFVSPMEWIGCGNGIESPGFVLANFTNWVTGWITTFFSDIVLKNASAWVTGMICDGILGGIFAVIGFLPQILLLFFFFSLMEDSGYMARVAFILDRLFRRFGLSGRAFLPMIMGFGCGVPAMMNTRTLTTDKERTQTIRVIPFFTCSAKLPIITAIAGVLLSSFGIKGASYITFSVYVAGMAIAIIAVLIMHSTTQREKIPPFIMELPAYHLPQPRALAIHIWDKAKHFFKKTFTIILSSTILVWLFSRISWDWRYLGQEGILFAYNDDGALWAVLDGLKDAIDAGDLSAEVKAACDALVKAGQMNEDMTLVDYTSAMNNSALAEVIGDYFSTTEVIPNMNQSILGSLGGFFAPLFTPMGWGVSCAYAPHVISGSNGSWAFSVSAITGLVAKENAIGTFGTLASSFNGLGLPDGVLGAIDTEGDAGIGAVTAIVRATFQTNADGSLVDELKTSASLISFVMFNVTTIPCFASVATAKSELMNRKAYLGTLAFWLCGSYIVGCLTYMVIAYWWTSFIVIALLALLFVGLHFYSKAKDKKEAQIA